MAAAHVSWPLAPHEQEPQDTLPATGVSDPASPGSGRGSVHGRLLRPGGWRLLVGADGLDAGARVGLRCEGEQVPASGVGWEGADGVVGVDGGAGVPEPQQFGGRDAASVLSKASIRMNHSPL